VAAVAVTAMHEEMHADANQQRQQQRQRSRQMRPVLKNQQYAGKSEERQQSDAGPGTPERSVMRATDHAGPPYLKDHSIIVA